MKKVAVFIITVAVILIATLYILLPSNTSAISSLPPQQFHQELTTNNATLIDIRTIDEYKAGHLQGAEQIDYYQTHFFDDYLDSLDKNKKYLIYCRSGNRTGKALAIMKQKGFTNVSDLAGGYNAWVTAGLPIEK